MNIEEAPLMITCEGLTSCIDQKGLSEANLANERLFDRADDEASFPGTMRFCNCLQVHRSFEASAEVKIYS